jgi:hypothetical protein
MNHVRLHKLFSQYSSARARLYIIPLWYYLIRRKTVENR